MSADIVLTKLTKHNADRTIYRNFSLTIREGEVVTIFGPNGCGKSTLLNIIAGITSYDEGNVTVDRSSMSYVFQHYRASLLPWKNNLDNVRFPLELQHWQEVDIVQRIRDMEAQFGVVLQWDAYPYTLSGGQQQILALFRALVTHPRILLIDEAFSALDFENNLLVRDILQTYYVHEQPTIIMVTHNIEEAVHLGQRVLVLPRAPIADATAIHNGTKYPRTIDYTSSKHFYRVKESVLSSFCGYTSV